MPLGATYCHSGPSCVNSQLVQVFPPSVERPQPLPTVPYQIAPSGPNPNAWTKSQEMEWPAAGTWEHIGKSADTTAHSISWDFVHAFGFRPLGAIWYGTGGNGWGLPTDGRETRAPPGVT